MPNTEIEIGRCRIAGSTNQGALLCTVPVGSERSVNSGRGKTHGPAEVQRQSQDQSIVDPTEQPLDYFSELDCSPGFP